MTTEETGSQTKVTDNGTIPQSAPVCGPACACGNLPSPTAKKIKVAVCLIVVLAIGGILFFKTAAAKKDTPDAGASEFASLAVTGQKAPLTNPGEKAGGCILLPSINALNALAAEF